MKALGIIIPLLFSPLMADDGKPKSLDESLRLQIFLDQKGFGPGFLDGKPGKFTSGAVYAYNRVQGRAPGNWEALLSEAQQDVPVLYATATVPSFAVKYVNPELPTEREDQAKEKMMAYRSYLEFMAERYHTSESFLLALNNSGKMRNLKPRQSLKVPNIQPFLIEELAVGRSYKKEEQLSRRTIVVDTSLKQIFIYDPAVVMKVSPGAAVVVEDDEVEEQLGAMVAMFPITPGQEEFIHRGNWKIRNCVELPEWRYDKSFLEKGVRGDEFFQIPPGPNNPVGVLWAGLTKSGIGIHGTSTPRTIGRAQSAGCYRLSNWDAARFSGFARPGTRVIVR
ncbi:MAG: L,D-transpeptidase [Akkermansiaceae bacterium]